MRIESLEAVPYSIPYRRPLAFGVGEVREAAHVLLRIRTDEGLVGQADVLPRPYTYGETVGSILAAVRELFAPVLVGLDPGNRRRSIAYWTTRSRTTPSRQPSTWRCGTSWGRSWA